MKTTLLPRIFSFNNRGQNIELADIDSRLSPESVLNFYSQTYPLLTTAKIEGPEIVNDRIEFKFVTTIGTKG